MASVAPRDFLVERAASLQTPGGFVHRLFLTMLPAVSPRVFLLTGIGRQLSSNRSVEFAGAGLSFDEALTKLLGEAAERNALEEYCPTSLVHAPYALLQGQSGEAIPRDLLDLYSQSALEAHGGIQSPFDETRVEDWVHFPSLMKPGRTVLAPASMVLKNVGRRDQGGSAFGFFNPSGIAAHTSLPAAMLESLLESLEADAYMIHWYSLRKAPTLDVTGSTVISSVVDQLRLPPSLELRLQYISLPHTPIHVVVAYLFNRERTFPTFSLGLGRGLDVRTAVCHALIEAASLFVSSKAFLFSYLDKFDRTVRPDRFYSLETNYLYHQRPDLRSTILSRLDSLVDGDRSIPVESLPDLRGQDVLSDLGWVLHRLGEISRFASAIELTTPDVRCFGYRVVRCFVPELVPIMPPSLPFDRHKMLNAYGGVRNDLPHPVP